MANFFFDGTANVTAAKADNVLITANPALFVSEAQVGSNVVITYNNGTTLTVTGASLNDVPGIQLASGTFSSGSSVNVTTTTANALVFSPAAGTTVDVSGGGTSTSIKTVFGGLGVSDSTDTADAIVLGGKGSFLIYGNAGSDAITQAGGTTGAFDSQSFVTVFAGKNDANGLTSDSVTLANVNNTGAKMAIFGGEGTDTISIFNTGTGANTAIFGGQGAADSTDSADTISFSGGGTVNIFGNAGADSITLGAGGLATGSSVTIHGGIGADSIDVKATTLTSSSITVFGDENSTGQVDTIVVGGNGGSTTIYGGTAAADSADGNDTINFSGQGTTYIYAAGGNDTVVVNTSGLNVSAADGTTPVGQGGATVAAAGGSATNVFLGNGNDSINILGAATARGVTTVNGGAGDDVFTVGTNAPAAATVAASLAGSGVGTVTIEGFGVGLDTIRVNNGDAGGGTVTANTTTFASLTAALDAAAAGAANANATVVSFNGDSYIVLDRSGAATFDATADLAIKLTGISNTTAVAAVTTIL